ncbi:MAG: hypothetical protein Q4B03_09970 [Lachnospiraceae bacterium]|nr:hypothetical protein [Lachnospiraceae bacterium]
MMKKKLVTMVTAGMLTGVLVLSGCGGSGSSADHSGESAASVSSTASSETGEAEITGTKEPEGSTIAGNYISVVGEMWGVSLTGEDMEGFSINLEDGGACTLVVDGDSGNASWTEDGDILTIEIEGEEIQGTIGEDILVFEDMLGMGMDITFAKEGTDAAKPENYLPEEDKAMLGVWNSHTVTTILGDDASGEVDPEGLTIEFFSDRTAAASLSGSDLGTTSWSSDFKYFDDEYLLSRWETIEGSDDIIITYTDDDNYWEFTLTKAE